jgi:hypothetical protein
MGSERQKVVREVSSCASRLNRWAVPWVRREFGTRYQWVAGRVPPHACCPPRYGDGCRRELCQRQAVECPTPVCATLNQPPRAGAFCFTKTTRCGAVVKRCMTRQGYLFAARRGVVVGVRGRKGYNTPSQAARASLVGVPDRDVDDRGCTCGEDRHEGAPEA